ncbi:Glucose-1-phosphate thymidylyltransferase [Thermoplasmatales archaeon BRNA1]|nr:Glucose-1-phosphate thymidylyltransferase [Thermoplasmatales archaeon BRNA1]
MKGIILAAGKGTRLYPASSHISKILLPIYDKPMIYYPLSTLMSAGIRDILVIVNKDDRAYFKKLLGDGKQFGISIKYAVQKVQKGIADALIIGEKFADGDNVALALGDNVFYGEEMYELLAEAMSITDGACVFCHEVEDARAFGVAEFGPDGNIVDIEEKPKDPKSNAVVVGLYFYDKECSKLAKTLKPSARGEIEITDLNKLYIKQGKLKALVTGPDTIWADTGTFESLLDASNRVHEVEKTGRAIVGCPEEVALRMGFITKKQLHEWVKKSGSDNAYYGYLNDLASEE